MKKIKYVFLGLLMCSLLAKESFAQGNSGFYGAADLNFALGFQTGDASSKSSDSGIGISLRPGYQATDEWIAMLDLAWTFYSKDNTDTTLGMYMIAGQYYFMPEAYVRPSFGFSKTKSSTGSIETETDLGFALGIAGGYEYPVMDQLVVGPTARLVYNRINPPGSADGWNFWNFSVGVEAKYAF